MKKAFIKPRNSSFLYPLDSISNYPFELPRTYKLYIIDEVYILQNFSSFNDLKSYNPDAVICTFLPLTDISFTSTTVSYLKNYVETYFDIFFEG